MSKSKILFFLSGSIAGFKACQVISRLVQEGHEVQTVATPSTFKFVGESTLEGLTGRPVFHDLWEPGRAMDHIHLSRWADFGVLCPASAATIGRIANGLADDLVSTMILAWPKGKPLHIFPAMNHEMLTAAPTQENLAKLSQRGLLVAPSGKGNLACGEQGEGRLPEPEEILECLFESRRTGSILITSGATREPIDGIRFISNVSSGQTGAALCDELSRLGYEVTYLHGAGAKQPSRAARSIEFESFQDLNNKMRTELGQNSFTGVIHCAAVSDYSVDRVGNVSAPDTTLKLGTQPDLTLRLKANFKILPQLREYSRDKNITVVGFKLTLNSEKAAQLNSARAILTEGVDAVVANDWSAVNRDRSRHPGTIVTRESQTGFTDLKELSESLASLFSQTKESL